MLPNLELCKCWHRERKDVFSPSGGGTVTEKKALGKREAGQDAADDDRAHWLLRLEGL